MSCLPCHLAQICLTLVVSFGFPLAEVSGGFYHFNYTIKIQTMQTTLNKIKEHNPCKDGWEKLLNHLNKTQSDDEVLELRIILESNGIDDAIWAFRAVEGKDKEIILFAADCAELVLPIYEKDYPDDSRPRLAIQAARDYANGLITLQELAAEWGASSNAATAAAWAARGTARNAATAAAGAACTAAAAAGGACTAAAAAARGTSWAAAGGAAGGACTAAKAAARDEIKQLLLKYI